MWDAEHIGIADYVPLPVEHFIHPELQGELVVGDVICFSSNLVNGEGKYLIYYWIFKLSYNLQVYDAIWHLICVLAGQLGVWSSSSSNILQISPKTGTAVARDSGLVTVYYDIPGHIKTYREVSFANNKGHLLSLHSFHAWILSNIFGGIIALLKAINCFL